MDILNRIRQLMGNRDWSEYRLAKEARLSQSTISNMFQRNTLPSIPTLEAICSAFGITMAQFFSTGMDMAALSDEQQALLKRWALLTDAQRNALMQLLESM